ncbi:MAG: hypothetical protein WAU32_14135 [Thermoanaerobaculia bacterium]
MISMLMAVWLAASAPAAVPSIAGQWESAVRNKGGIGNILEFSPDGKVTQISAMMSDATWSLQGEWLRTTYTNEETGKLQESAVRIEYQGPDRFVEKDENDAEQGFSERVGARPPGDSPLVGKWCSLFLETLTTYRQFTPDGQLFVRLPVTVLRGTYAVAGDTLEVNIAGQPPGRYPFRLDEQGRLVIKNREGAERVYKRTPSTLLKGY